MHYLKSICSHVLFFNKIGGLLCPSNDNLELIFLLQLQWSLYVSVFLPFGCSQVAKALSGIMSDPIRMELENLEKQKVEIDRVAESKVRSELWAGLFVLVAQTAALMRLTFWELSWDVMEPMCFFITSGYCGAAFLFYLITQKEPCFENLFHVRFVKKQKKLMKDCNFDRARYEDLKTAAAAFYPQQSSSSSTTWTTSVS